MHTHTHINICVYMYAFEKMDEYDLTNNQLAYIVFLFLFSSSPLFACLWHYVEKSKRKK